jgi:hypothetical protein
MIPASSPSPFRIEPGGTSRGARPRTLGFRAPLLPQAIFEKGLPPAQILVTRAHFSRFDIDNAPIDLNF